MSNDNKLALDRIIFFSDAVFAIAITLLALELRVPDMPTSQVAAEMPQRLAGMMPKFVSFILSFVIIGSYWRAHHRDFLYIQRWDTRLIWINLMLLMFVAFLPFSNRDAGQLSRRAVHCHILCGHAGTYGFRPSIAMVVCLAQLSVD